MNQVRLSPQMDGESPLLTGKNADLIPKSFCQTSMVRSCSTGRLLDSTPSIRFYRPTIKPSFLADPDSTAATRLLRSHSFMRGVFMPATWMEATYVKLQERAS